MHIGSFAPKQMVFCILYPVLQETDRAVFPQKDNLELLQTTKRCIDAPQAEHPNARLKKCATYTIRSSDTSKRRGSFLCEMRRRLPPKVGGRGST
eukprot:1161677-Pelagomonas_calceolata.AAC.18